jgi:hypothetical protein
VGHVLKSDGVCFSTEKRTEVLDVELPVKQKQLKSFLGLVNYFRDHVQGLSLKVKPLNNIMIPYKKGTSIDWTPRLDQCKTQLVHLCEGGFCYILHNNEV